MALIECKRGSATTPVGDQNYSFDRDRYGRFVAEVSDVKHVKILTGLADVYHEVPEDPTYVDEIGATPTQADWIQKAKKLLRSQADTIEELGAQLQLQKQSTENVGASTGVYKVKIESLEADVQRLSDEAAESFKLISELKGTIEVLNAQLAAANAGSNAGAGAHVADNISILAGLGDASQEKLATKSITTFAQLAALTPEEMEALDKELKLGGASLRNDWIGQAKAKLAEAQQA